jgi:hypothetical protein
MALDFLKRAKALFTREEPEPPKPAAPARKPAQPYHAVTIAPGSRACPAAFDLRGTRYLSREAPPLPLKDCNAKKCECRYEHHDDRRKNARRARDMHVSIAGYEGRERRGTEKRGRRKTD